MKHSIWRRALAAVAATATAASTVLVGVAVPASAAETTPATSVSVSTWNDLKLAFLDAPEGEQALVTLEAPITALELGAGLSDALIIPTGRDVVLDLGAHSLTILNTATATTGNAGIRVMPDSSFTVKSTPRTGMLTVSGADQCAGIGGCMGAGAGDIRIESGTIVATGGQRAPGIGTLATQRGLVEIAGGNVTANGGTNAAGIGTGYPTVTANRDAGGYEIRVSNGTVRANGGMVCGSLSGAGIGTGAYGYNFAYTQTGGTVYATGGDRSAGLGTGTYGGGATIRVDGGYLQAVGHAENDLCGGTPTRTHGGAGIGVGSSSTTPQGIMGVPLSVTINGGTVRATGGEGGAGIGCAYYSQWCQTVGAIKVTINGGDVTATGMNGSAGIGTGYANGDNGFVFVMTGGVVTARGSAAGAGIGSGWYSRWRRDYGGSFTYSGGYLNARGDGSSGIGSTVAFMPSDTPIASLVGAPATGNVAGTYLGPALYANPSGGGTSQVASSWTMTNAPANRRILVTTTSNQATIVSGGNVSWAANGGTNLVGVTTTAFVPFNGKISPIPSPTPPAGKVFVGWTLTKDGDDFYDPNMVVTQDVTLYAKYAGIYDTTSIPTISGKLESGETLTADPGYWNPTPAAFKYQWLRDGVAISGATASTYTLTDADKLARITVKVTGSDPSYGDQTVTSAETSPIAGSFVAPAPRVIGTAVNGRTLTVSTGKWEPSAKLAYQWLRDGAVIAGAKQQTYTLTSADLGKRISVRVTGTATDYVAKTVTSTETAAVLNTFAVSSPTISGQPLAKETITVVDASWSPQPTEITYQWLRDGVAIEGATSKTYTLKTTDVGHDIAVWATGTKEGYAPKSVVSSPVMGVNTFTEMGTPTITGTLAVGSTVTAHTGTWVPATTFAYEWTRNGQVIDGATASTYTLTENDRAAQIRVTIRTTDPLLLERTAQSAPVGPIQGVFTSAPAPVVVGRALLGSTLTVDTGEWVPAPQAMSIQWLRDGLAVPSATTKEYAVTEADYGHTLSVRVAVTLDGYVPTTKLSVAGTLVRNSFTDTPVPVISGEATVGETLTVATGDWEPTPDSLTLQWYRGSSAIAGATGTSYELTADDFQQSMSVRVTGSKTAYVWASVASVATDPVRDQWTDTPVTIEGELITGETVTAVLGDWLPEAPTKIAYQWYRGDGAIQGATKSSYKLQTADAGATISVRLKATHDAYLPVEATAVSAGPAVLSFDKAPTPVIEGQAIVGTELSVQEGEWVPTPSATQRQWYRDGVEIDGATGTSYVLTEDDADATITVRVTGEHPDRATASRVSTEYGPVLRPWIQTADPAIVDAFVGTPATVELGTWEPTADSVEYQWFIGGKPVEGATEAEYTPELADLGKVISVQTTTIKDGYVREQRMSAERTVGKYRFDTVPTVVPVTYDGDAPAAGTVLTADITTAAWSPAADSLDYRWLRDGAEIIGATSETYTVLPEDGGADLQVRVTARRLDTESSSVTSEPLTVTLGEFVSAPAMLSVRGLTGGKVAVGSPVNVAAFETVPVANSTRYEWLADGEVLETTQEPQWTVSASALGATLSVRAVVSAQGYADITIPGDVTFEATIGAYTTLGTPSISGDAGVGYTLTALTGSWAPTPTSFTYQWFRTTGEGVDEVTEAIDGATAATYDVTEGDLASRLSVSVTAVKLGYETHTVTSAKSEPIKAGFTGRPLSLPVTGTTTVGQTLSFDVAQLTWTPTPESVSIQWFSVAEDAEPVAIGGATGTSLVLTADLMGLDVFVKVTPSLTGYAGGAVQSIASTITAGTITVTGDVTIEGEAKVGSEVTAVYPTADLEVTPTIEWRIGDEVIATGASYTVTPEVAGRGLKVVAIYALPGYATVTLETPESVVANADFVVGTVTIDGARTLGTTLTADLGTWTPVPAAESISYQWNREGVAIDGATAATYVVTDADLGKRLALKVTVNMQGYNVVEPVSNTVIGLFNYTSKPTLSIAGTATVGQTLSAKLTGSWKPNAPTTVKYQWYRGATAIAGATKSTYKLAAADAGKQITVKISTSRTNFPSVELTTKAVTPLALFKTAPVPKITGTLKVGQTLKVTTGTWSPKATFTYQWYRGTTKIAGATKATYKLAAADAGKQIKVVVTGRAAKTATTAKTSALTKKIAK